MGADSSKKSIYRGEELAKFYEEQNKRLSPRFRAYEKESRISFEEATKMSATRFFDEEDEDDVKVSGSKCPHRTQIWGVDHGRCVEKNELENKLRGYKLQESDTQKDTWDKQQCAKNVAINNNVAIAKKSSDCQLLETVHGTKHCPRYGCYTWTIRVENDEAGEVKNNLVKKLNWNEGLVIGFIPRHEYDFNFEFDSLLDWNSAACFYIPGSVALGQSGQIIANGMVSNKEPERQQFSFSHGDRLQFILDYNTAQMSVIRLRNEEHASHSALLAETHDAVVLVKGFNTSYRYNLCAGFRTDSLHVPYRVAIEDHSAYKPC